MSKSGMKTILETERLILREIDPVADLEPWHDMMSDEETVRFIGGETLDRAGTWRQMANRYWASKNSRLCILVCHRKIQRRLDWPRRAVEPRRLARTGGRLDHPP